MRPHVLPAILGLCAWAAFGAAADFSPAARWIGAPGNGTPAFEADFAVTGAVRSAELLIAAPGFYEAYLDGAKIGDRVLDPSPTDFTKRVLFARLPVALTPGHHTLRLVLGHGWYDQRSTSAWNNDRDRWRAEPCARAELHVTATDGSRLTVATDRTWRQVASPLAWDDLREGEIVDPGRVLPRPGLGAAAVEVKGPAGRLVEMTHPPARVVREIPVKKSWRVKNGWMLDFGENLSGWCRMTFAGGKRGDIVTVRYDERIRPDGEPTTRVERRDVPRRNRMELWPDRARVLDCYVFAVGSTNVLAGGIAQQDRFVLTGGGSDVYAPRFTYHGFRYVWVRGVDACPHAVACEVRTDFAKRTLPDCGDADVDALVRMAVRSYESNFTDGVPTDCPHREKNGWTGDASAACEFAQYAFDNTEAYLKWIGDLVDAQRDDGAIPGVVPSGGWGWTEDGKYGYGPVWDGVIAYLPWMIYVYRDDDRGLRRAYPALKRYVAHVEKNLDGKGLVRFGLGDWITCGHYTDQRFCGTAYYYGLLQIAEKTARLHGETAAAADYARLAERVKRDFNRAFYHGDGRYADGYQTQQALPLTFGLCPPDARDAVAAKLVEAVHAAGDRIDFGLVGSKHVFRALSAGGHTDLALKMLKDRAKPSFLHWRDAGSSTLWEDWETGFSRNHVMFCDFAAWACQYLAGRRLPPGGTPAVPDPAVRGL